MSKYSYILLTLLLGVSITLAQDSCSTFIQDALNSLDDTCSNLGRNQVCYGNIQIDVTGRSDNFSFEKVGDIVELNDIETIQTAPLDQALNVWGVGVLRLQANIPDTLPGQNVTMLVFGDTTLENAVEPTTPVDMVAIAGVNIRRSPTTSAVIIGSLSSGDTVTAVRRLDDDSWVQVRLGDGRLGWVSSDFVMSEMGIDELNAIEPDDALYTSPMQAIVMQTGIGISRCDDAPLDGLLVQTPEGDFSVEMTINGLEVILSSTAFIQAVAGDEMSISLLEGQAVISAFGVTQTVPAGTRSVVPLDENGLVSSAPSFPQPYEETVLGIPVTSLERSIEIAEPLSLAEISASLSSTNAQDGSYNVSISGAGCSLSEIQTFTFGVNSLTVNNSGGTNTLPRTGDGVYSGTVNLGSGVIATTTITVISSTRLEGTLVNDSLNCTITADYVG